MIRMLRPYLHSSPKKPRSWAGMIGESAKANASLARPSNLHVATGSLGYYLDSEDVGKIENEHMHWRMFECNKCSLNRSMLSTSDFRSLKDAEVEGLLEFNDSLDSIGSNESSRVE